MCEYVIIQAVKFKQTANHAITAGQLNDFFPTHVLDWFLLKVAIV
jgi:hypothetical protein